MIIYLVRYDELILGNDGYNNTTKTMDIITPLFNLDGSSLVRYSRYIMREIHTCRVVKIQNRLDLPGIFLKINKNVN
jgi:hypothetical protein